MNLKPILLTIAALLLASRAKGSTTAPKVTKNALFGRISSKFGNRINPITGATQFHNGIDIPTPTGTPIVALRNGYVLQINKTELGGNQLRIKLSDNYTLGFSHLSKTLLKEKSKFKAGQILAYSGATGKVTGAHIHFTVRNPQNELIDPVKYLATYQ